MSPVSFDPEVLNLHHSTVEDDFGSLVSRVPIHLIVMQIRKDPIFRLL